jgi:hypothetical protein
MRLKDKLFKTAISFVLLFYFLIISYVYITDSAHYFVIVNQFFGITAFGVYLAKGKMQLSWLVPTILLLSSVLVSSILISRSPFGFGNIANIISASGIAILILRNKIYMNVVLAWFLLVSGYYFFLIFQGVIPDLAHATENSRNSVSIHMLFVTATIYIIYYLNRGYLPWWPALIFLVICLWAVGRGGILTSGILFTVILADKLKKMVKRASSIGVLMVGLIILVSIGDKVAFFFNELIEIERTINDAFSRTEVASSRDNILSDFYRNSSIVDIIIGQDLYKGVMWQEWGGNTHNSFISLIAYAGFFGVVTFVYWLYVNFKLFKLNFILGTLMFVVFIRLMTEYVVWFSVFDYLPFLFIYLYTMIKSKMKSALKTEEL